MHRQNDAAEFIHFLLGYSQPEAYSGRWEARISNDDSPLGFELRDSGDCYGPLVIDIAGPSLQHCLYHWHIHGQMHALTVPPTFLLLQLKRFHRETSGVSKDASPVSIQAGEVVRIPCFLNAQDFSTHIVQYEVRGVIFHIGQDLLSGHYRAALSSHASSTVNRGIFFLTDDNQLAYRAGSCYAEIDSGGYIVGLSRSRN